MKALWPELLVLGLFLAGDAFFSGFAAAAAGAAAGLTAYLVLLIKGQKKPGLIFEGLIFGAVTALGTYVQFPGGSLILMELVLGLILLVSVPAGWNLLQRMAGGVGRGLFSTKQASAMSLAMGGAFTAHAVVFAVLRMTGFGSTLTGILLFAVLYFGSLRFSAGKIRNLRMEEAPVLAGTGREVRSLTLRGELLGTFRLTDGRIAEIHEICLEAEQHIFLSNLEACLRQKGCRGLSISQWPEDELELQMRGYSQFEEKWHRRL